jgi:hypothetical protein
MILNFVLVVSVAKSDDRKDLATQKTRKSKFDNYLLTERAIKEERLNFFINF